MNVVDAIATACGRVPPLWPLTHFVAVNPFVGMTDLTFEAAERLVNRTAHARLLMPASYYVDALRDGRIGIGQVQATALSHRLRQAMDDDIDEPDRGRMLALSEWIDRHAARSPGWSPFVVDEISKWCSSYFDEGQATWTMPWSDRGLFDAWRAAAVHDRNPELMGLARFRQLAGNLPGDPVAVIREAAERLGVPDSAVEDYLLRLLMTVSGWSGYVQFRVREAAMADRVCDELVQLLAIRIVYDLALLDRTETLHGGAAAWREHLQQVASAVDVQPAAVSIRCAAQDALERTWQQQLAARLAPPHESPRRETAARPELQAVFCIDVRSEVFRRALESQSEGIQTLGFAGFFGMPLAYRTHEASEVSARCPVLLSPSIEATAPSSGTPVPSWMSNAWQSFRSSALSCFAFVETAGLAFGATLARELAAGRSAHAGPAVEPPASAPEVRITLEERVRLASGVLRNMGLTRTLAPVVLLCGHGSTTRNNPYASGLDCGACGGHAGDVNVRVAAALLNDQQVRDALAVHGIVVPDDTVFVAGLHDTATDDVVIEVSDEVRRTHGAHIERVSAWLVAAGRRARRERAGALGLGDIDDARLDAEVRRRAVEWSEVRPEWGLAGNAAFIAARRSRTRGVDLGGRAFLHDYDAAHDPDGSVLELIMTAPMVVASWINLQYYASAVDNERFGSGTKVLHNVVGAFGVWEGNGGDLRVGLPWQSVHDGTQLRHEPLRLNVFIEAPRTAIERVLATHRNVRELVEHRWVHLLAIEPGGSRCWRYTDGQWEVVGAEPRVMDIADRELTGASF